MLASTARVTRGVVRTPAISRAVHRPTVSRVVSAAGSAHVAAVEPWVGAVGSSVRAIHGMRDYAQQRRILEENPGSLVPDTVKEMETDQEFQALAKELKELGAKKMALREKKQRRRALDKLGVPTFREFLHAQQLPAPVKAPIEILQVNVGLTCNQACTHCHVESTPYRKETLDRATAEKIIDVLKASPSVKEVDITGGAPEMHAEWRFLVKEIRALGLSVIDRCNLTVLYEPGQEDLPDFLAEHGVRVVASLPCYSARNVNKQRGRGVFQRSIQALLDLNERGYGKEGTGLSLDLVYNPGGGFLPPSQDELEAAYKEELRSEFGIEFNNLFTITNMPVKRFADFLYRRKQLEDYMKLLIDSFNPAALSNTMCHNLVSVRWDGQLFDCDFNLALHNPLLNPEDKLVSSLHELTSLDELVGRACNTGSHCFGCTAGQGSS